MPLRICITNKRHGVAAVEGTLNNARHIEIFQTIAILKLAIIAIHPTPSASPSLLSASAPLADLLGLLQGHAASHSPRGMWAIRWQIDISKKSLVQDGTFRTSLSLHLLWESRKNAHGRWIYDRVMLAGASQSMSRPNVRGQRFVKLSPLWL